MKATALLLMVIRVKELDSVCGLFCCFVVADMIAAEYWRVTPTAPDREREGDSRIILLYVDIFNGG